MNPTATEFYPSTDIRFNQSLNDHTDFLHSYLSTINQVHNAQSILDEWHTSLTLSTLIQNLTHSHITQSTVQSNCSFLLYNVSSLSRHFEDIVQYICSSYPTMWALTGLHFNNQINYRAASFFRTYYTIYYQHG
jgi:hypothetical protein